ncbi:MAG: hypothetical protein IPL59_08710 [Candidatus Competibacteraceae bacterium]|nr:hypothetical protein [Candidatus Competibacteraceae bacterium]
MGMNKGAWQPSAQTSELDYKRLSRRLITADQIRREQRQQWPTWNYLPFQHWFSIAQAVWPNQKPTVENIADRRETSGPWRLADDARHLSL